MEFSRSPTSLPLIDYVPILQTMINLPLSFPLICTSYMHYVIICTCIHLHADLKLVFFSQNVESLCQRAKFEPLIPHLGTNHDGPWTSCRLVFAVLKIGNAYCESNVDSPYLALISCIPYPLSTAPPLLKYLVTPLDLSRN